MVVEAASPILEVKNVSKTFDGVVHALRGVSLAVRRHEMVGVVGENGAGKTTLMKILVGVHAPDGGELMYRGNAIEFPANPREAAGKGISIVYQERGVVPSLKVYQFLFLGHERVHSGRFLLRTGRMKADAARILEEFHVDCAVDSYMYELPLATRKMIEIAKAVLSIRLEQGGNDAQSVIILDEPTAPLSIEERHELMRSISVLKKTTSFIFVTHIMQEVMEFMDRVVVLRDGELVGHYDMSTDRVTEDDLARVIMGKEAMRSLPAKRAPAATRHETAISADRLTRRGCYYDISFDIGRGECVGIYGPAGCGKSELVKSIAGLMSFESGRLKMNGAVVGNRESPHKRLARGLGYFSGETPSQLFFEWSIAKNVSILNISRIVRSFLHVISFDREKRMAERILEALQIKASDINTEVYALSGGSKQKVTVGKWFERKPDILLLEDPTIGIDVGSRLEIYGTLMELKAQGVSMILVGDDPKEYYALCDRVILLKQGHILDRVTSEGFKKVMEA